jgi:chromosome segregation ATPase
MEPGLIPFVDKLEEWRALDMEDMRHRDHLEADCDQLREELRETVEHRDELLAEQAEYVEQIDRLRQVEAAYNEALDDDAALRVERDRLRVEHDRLREELAQAEARNVTLAAQIEQLLTAL